MFQNLFTDLFDCDTDFYRNIYTIKKSQNLLDDLSDSADERRYGEKAASSKPETTSLIISRPFEYGVAIASQPFGRPATRFSDGLRYGVWYGSFEYATTVYESVYHWQRTIKSVSKNYTAEIVTDRRIFLVHCRGLLIDLRDKDAEFSELANPVNYGFTHQVGAYLHEQQQNGLVAKSARCNGYNSAIFKPDVLSNPRHHSYITYRWKPGDKTVRVEKASGKRWMEIKVDV